MNTRTWRTGAALILLALFAFGTSRPVAAAGKSRPNVLLICVDDLKPALGCYGDTLAQSPHIDKLARHGLLFERAYCNQAVCSPSRNALLTGVRSQTLGIYDLATNFRRALPGAVTLPQAFKQVGYRTEALGKIFHVGHGNHDDAVSWSVPHWRPDTKTYALSKNRPGPGAAGKQKKRKAGNAPKGAAFERADVADNAYSDGAVADEAVRRLQSAAAAPEQPFFLAVGFVRPHLPFCAPAKYWDLYDPAKFPLAEPQVPPQGAPSYAPQFGGELRNYVGIPKQGVLPTDVQRNLIHGYYAAMSYMDAQVGRVLDELERLQLADNTIIVLWGDHGWHLGDHGIWCKHTNYEHAARIPLIVVAPKLTTPGSRTRSLVESVDVFPTLCDLAGVPGPESQLEGQSLRPVLSDPKAPTKDAILHVFPRNVEQRRLLGRAVRGDRYRLVEWKEFGAPAESAEIELYDYQQDPQETRNLASEQPDVVAKLRAFLNAQPEAKPQIRVSPPAAVN